jgi:hypothetical protein
MASTIFDSLPYYDNDLDIYPSLRAKVEKELAREGKPPQEIHSKVPPPIELFTVSTMSYRSLFVLFFFVEKPSTGSRTCSCRSPAALDTFGYNPTSTSWSNCITSNR